MLLYACGHIMCHDVRGCGDGVCVCVHTFMCTMVQCACVCEHSCGSIPKEKKKKRGRSGKILYLHVVNNQKLDGGKICERD